MENEMATIVQSEVNRMFMITIVSVLAAALVLPVIVGLFLPGRKGKMLTRRGADWKNITVEEARVRLSERLRGERFMVTPGPDPSTVAAERPKEVQQRAHAIHTHESKPLKGEFEIRPHVAGVTVEATLWTPDLVFCDTGEGRHIDELLNRLLSEEKEPPPLQVVPNVPYSATCSLTTAFVILVTPLILAIMKPDVSHALGVMHGLLLTCFVGVGLGIYGIRDTIVKPKEMRGRSLAIAGLVCSLAATAIALAVFRVLYSEALADNGFWKTIFEAFPSRGNMLSF